MLVVILSGIKFPRRDNFRHDRILSAAFGFQIRFGGLGGGFLFRSVIENRRSVVVAQVRPLPAFLTRVMDLPKAVCS